MKSRKKDPKKETPEHKLGGLVAVLLGPAMGGGMPQRVAEAVYDSFRCGWSDNDEFNAQTLLDAVKEYLVKVGA